MEWIYSRWIESGSPYRQLGELTTKKVDPSTKKLYWFTIKVDSSTRKVDPSTKQKYSSTKKVDPSTKKSTDQLGK